MAKFDLKNVNWLIELMLGERFGDGDTKFLDSVKLTAFTTINRKLQKYNRKSSFLLREREENWLDWTAKEKKNSWYRIQRVLKTIAVLEAQLKFFKENQQEEPNYNCIKNAVKVPRFNP